MECSVFIIFFNSSPTNMRQFTDHNDIQTLNTMKYTDNDIKSASLN